MQDPDCSHFALVLPGAVARGAYEAGVIQVLAESETKIDRIVATSSGALNGLAYAVGIRRGKEKEMAANLTKSWIVNGGWQNSLSLNPIHLLTGRGLSSGDGLEKMMRKMISPEIPPLAREIELQIIVTPLNGVVGSIGKKPATTYEKILKFSGAHLDTAESLEEVFKAVCAACAFPGLFQPVQLPELGACVDGGAVNNAPIAYALAESAVNRVIMPVPFPSVMPPGDWKSGLSLFNHLINILINERLYRDLKTAQSVNREADQLRELVREGVLTEDQMQKLKNALCIHNVEVTEIRPSEDLKISPFSGFFHQRDRVQLVEAGRKAAAETLAKLPKHNPHGVQTT